MKMQVFSVEEVSKHNTEESCWITRNGRVYDVTDFVPYHPGGTTDTIMKFAGKEVGSAMTSTKTHCHSVNALKLMADFQIGVLEGHENDPTEEDKDIIDWSKPISDQILALGDTYNAWINAPRYRKARIFKSDFIEFFSHCPWYGMLPLWLPIIGYNLVQSYIILSARPAISLYGLEFIGHPLMIIPFTIMGCFAWLIPEYFLHRYLFHMNVSGKSQFLMNIQFFSHGLHHKNPFVHNRIVASPLYPVSLLVLPIYVGFKLVIPFYAFNAMFAGGSAYYLFYELTHYYLHVGQPAPNSYFDRLKRSHNKHHFINHNKGYGTTARIFDLIMGTNFGNGKDKSN